jgi:Undecaprenyl-phosphate glucose phosphotransferase
MSEEFITRSLFLEPPSDVITSGPLRFPQFSPSVFVYASTAIDFVLLYSLCIIFCGNSFASASSIIDARSVQLIVSFAVLTLFSVANLHRIEVVGDFNRFKKRFVRTWIIAFFFFAAVDVLFFEAPRDATYYVVWLPAWFMAGWLAFSISRFILARLFERCVEHELVSHNVVIVGGTELARKLIDRIRNDKFGTRVRAIFETKLDNTGPRTIADVPVRGDIDDLLLYNKRNKIDTVVIAVPLQDDDEIRNLIRKLTYQPLKVTALPGALALETPRNWCAPAGELPGVYLMSIMDLPIDGAGLFIKGLFDKFVASLAILFFGPLMLACALMIKLTSPGPMLFLQKRIGYKNREFYVFKFRSMHVTACSSDKLTERNDPRVFGFGQVMRKLSLDELPQLFNVLKGDMSLVGPRPHMPLARVAGQFYFDAVPDYAARHRIKPGITGWAQVNGWRGPTDTLSQLENRVRHDLYYIENWSFLLDVQILVKTAFVGFFGKNAY